MSTQNLTFEVVRGSLLDQKVDAIVNAANPQMRGGGGIDGMVHEAAGRRMLATLHQVAPNGAEVGEVVVTPGFDLPQRYVLHVAGPIWVGGSKREPEQLADCYRNAIIKADELGCESIGFCSISTGIYGFPLELGASIAVRTLLETGPRCPSVRRIVLAMFGSEEHRVFAGVIAG